ncbi:MAG: glycosyltransferase family 2 protein [Candidatus Dormibacteria bacterium]
MLSVIVPAYREGARIAENIGHLTNALDALDMPYEVVVVCDGSPDDTHEQARTCASERVKVFSYPTNMGKGYALKYGFEQSKGDPVTFIDADMDLHPREIGIFIKLMDIYDADVVVGSKRHPQSKVNYPPFRRFQSWVYQMLVRALFDLNVSDTQTGLKLFRRSVLEASLPRIVVNKFAFDLELFVIAHRMGFRNFIEAPVLLDFQFSSSVDLGSARQVLRDTLMIYRRLRWSDQYGGQHRADTGPDPSAESRQARW